VQVYFVSKKMLICHIMIGWRKEASFCNDRTEDMPLGNDRQLLMLVWKNELIILPRVRCLFGQFGRSSGFSSISVHHPSLFLV
jgi:hypothetical protein